MKKLSKKQILLGSAIFVFILGAVMYVFAVAKNNQNKSSNPTTTGGEVNYNPPTKEETAEAEQHKNDIAKQADGSTPTDNSTGKKRANVVVTNTNQSEQDITVIAYVQGVFENGGTCTATFIKDSIRVSKTSEAFANVSTTNCAPFIIQKSEFASQGEWQLVVTYTSPVSEGSSQAKNITITKSQ